MAVQRLPRRPATRRRELGEQATAVGGIGCPADQADVLEPAERLGHASGGLHERLAQSGGRHPVRRAHEQEGHEHPILGRGATALAGLLLEQLVVELAE
ncbi:hypothetical protein B7486_77840, partial [cyanobacterium TDX16]